MHSTPDRAVRVPVLTGDIVLCSRARHFTLTVPVSIQVYKWVLENSMRGGNLAMDQHPIRGWRGGGGGGAEIFQNKNRI